MSTVDDLMAAVTPSGEMRELEWSDAEAHVGRRLPDDIKGIVAHYAGGRFGNDLWIFSPDEIVRWSDGIVEELAARQTMLSRTTHFWVGPDGEQLPVDLGGSPIPFVAWGESSTGGAGYWLVDGEDSDRWPAMVTDFNGVWLFHPDGVAALLLAMASGRYPENLGRSDFREYTRM